MPGHSIAFPEASRLVVRGLLAAALAVGGRGAGAESSGEPPAAPATPIPPPLVFEGFGLGQFEGAGSIAAELRKVEPRDAPREDPFGVPLDLVVKGPTGRDRATDPLRAELRGGGGGLDLVAGVQADPALVQEGPAKWTGAVRLSTPRPDGKDAVELKTSLDRRQPDAVRLELGPRIERRLRRGAVVFLDGKAQAQARRSPETGGWLLPGLTEGQGLGTIGVTATTGISR